MTAKILFLVNPVAHRAKPKNIKRFCRLLEEKGAHISLILTKSEDEAIKIARETPREQYDLLAVAGGDGTIAGVASGLYALQKAGISPLPLWIVPLGTANVLARELNIPLNLKKNAHYLLEKARPREIWPGIIESIDGEKFFLQMASAGLDAETVANVSYSLKKYLGGLAYIFALIECLKKPLPLVTLSLKQKGISESFQASCAIFSRGSLYGGPFCIAKNQHPSADETTLILFQPRHKIAFFLSILGALLPFSFLKKQVCLKKIGPEDECHFLGNGAVQADGDLRGRAPVMLKRAPFPLTFLY